MLRQPHALPSYKTVGLKRAGYSWYGQLAVDAHTLDLVKSMVVTLVKSDDLNKAVETLSEHSAQDLVFVIR